MRRFVILFLAAVCGARAATIEFVNAASEILYCAIVSDGTNYAQTEVPAGGTFTFQLAIDASIEVYVANSQHLAAVAEPNLGRGKWRVVARVEGGNVVLSKWRYPTVGDEKIPWDVQIWAFVSGLTLAMLLAIWAWTRNAFNESLG